MNTLQKNILLFIIGLAAITLSVEVMRHGRLQIEEPVAFIVAIVVLGIVGGWVLTWLKEGQGK